MAITRLSGGTTPANGSDPRTFPAIWNDTADDIEAAESNIATLQGDVSAIEAWDLDDINDVVITSATTGEVLKYDGTNWINGTDASGKILQVVSTLKDDAFSTASLTATDVTGLSVSITPSSSSSDVFVLVELSWAMSFIGSGSCVFLLTDGSDNDLIPADSGTTMLFQSAQYGDTSRLNRLSFSFLHSPATTSSFTYKIRARTTSSDRPCLVNRNGNNNNFTVSTITAMEVAG